MMRGGHHAAGSGVADDAEHAGTAVTDGDLERDGPGITATSARSDEAGGTPAEARNGNGSVWIRRRDHEVSILIGAGTGEGWCFG